jgi:hypothetical protein
MTPTWEGVISPSVASSITVVGIKDDLSRGMVFLWAERRK